MTKDARQRPPPVDYVALSRVALDDVRAALAGVQSLTPGAAKLSGRSSSSSAPSGGGVEPSSAPFSSPNGPPDAHAHPDAGSTPAASSSTSSSTHPLDELVELERRRLEALPPATPATTKRKRTSSSSRRRATPRPGRSARRAAMAARFDAGGAVGCRPRDFRREVVAVVPAIMGSLSGEVARDRLARFPRDFGTAVYRIAIHSPTGAQLPDSLQHVWSRLVVACAFILWRSRRRAERHGFEWVVDGFTQKMILQLLTNAQTGDPYRRSRVFGENGRGELGPMLALQDAGLYWRQPRTLDANPRFLGRARTRIVQGKPVTFRPAFAVYWLAAPDTPA